MRGGCITVKKAILYTSEAIDSTVHECPWKLKVIQLVKKFMCQLRLWKGGDYEGKNVLTYDTVPPGRNLQMLWRDILPPSSGSKSKQSKQMTNRVILQTKDNHAKHQSGQLVTQPRFELGISETQRLLSTFCTDVYEHLCSTQGRIYWTERSFGLFERNFESKQNL
jgi:hypothetical protein